jgi:hypothetical protein
MCAYITFFYFLFLYITFIYYTHKYIVLIYIYIYVFGYVLCLPYLVLDKRRLCATCFKVLFDFLMEEEIKFCAE